jgi:hypothetical protein
MSTTTNPDVDASEGILPGPDVLAATTCSDAILVE